jgi:DNA adenine methylase
MNAPTRPALRYMGGKWRLAPWIVSHFPPHRTYVEPFGGAAGVLLRKPRAFQEIYNDMDGEIVALFRVLRDPELARELAQALYFTPWAREEYEACYIPSEDPVENARRTIARSFMGFGASAIRNNTGFRCTGDRNGKHHALDFAGLPENVLLLCERLRGVVIEHGPAIPLMEKCDTVQTLHYVDPPYVHSTRGDKHLYSHEMTNAEHEQLLQFLLTLQGSVIVSGYSSELYEDLLAGWPRTQKAAMADGAGARTEVLWKNPRAMAGADLFTPALERWDPPIAYPETPGDVQ